MVELQFGVSLGLDLNFTHQSSLPQQNLDRERVSEGKNMLYREIVQCL